MLFGLDAASLAGRRVLQSCLRGILALYSTLWAEWIAGRCSISHASLAESFSRRKHSLLSAGRVLKSQKRVSKVQGVSSEIQFGRCCHFPQVSNAKQSILRRAWSTFNRSLVSTLSLCACLLVFGHYCRFKLATRLLGFSQSQTPQSFHHHNLHILAHHHHRPHHTPSLSTLEHFRRSIHLTASSHLVAQLNSAQLSSVQLPYPSRPLALHTAPASSAIAWASPPQTHSLLQLSRHHQAPPSSS